MLAAMGRAALWLYRIALRVGLPLAAPVLWVRDRASGKDRPPLRQRLGRGLPAIEPGGLWIQAVSVGEVEVARRLVETLQYRPEAIPLLVTSTTATGLALARKTLAGTAAVHPCPLDLVLPVRRVLEAARPRALVLVETELWPEMLHQAGRRGVPVAVVNARLSEYSFRRYRRFRPLLAPLLDPIALVAARSDSDAERFETLGVPGDRITVTGNVKYDLEPDRTPLEWEAAFRRWAGDRFVLVAGSTMEGEEAMLLDAIEFAGGPERIVTILAPRHPERFDAVAALLERRGLPFVRRSALDAGADRPAVLLLDTIGELARAYRLGDAAFIGGSLVNTGGHNPLEAAVWGVPVTAGPNLFNFSEVYAEMITSGGVLVGVGVDDLARVLEDWIADPAARRRVGEAARATVEANRGAAERTVDAVLDLARSS